MRRLVSLPEGDEGDEPSVNLTPLIDVVFVVLFAFIILAPLLEHENVELAAANPATVQRSSPSAAQAIVIGVRRDNSISVNKQTVTLQALPQLLTLLRQRQPTAPLHLFHDRSAAFGTYQSIKNAAEGAGFSSMEVFLVEK